ncbi:MAG: hypothetical protein KAT04_15785 [Methylococcales bacterium]|nr:hypothetical protein [Methylococcales bacterium]
MKINNFNLFLLLFLFGLSLFLSTSNQTARWGLAPDETFGFSLFAFFLIFLGNSIITIIAKSKRLDAYPIASALTTVVMITGGLTFAWILSFAIYTKNYDYSFYWMFGTLVVIYISTITTYTRFRKYNKK